MADEKPVIKNRRAIELPSFTWSEWDSVQMVKSAIRNLENGQFDAASLVVDAMTRDDRLRITLEKRTSALGSLPRTVELGKGGNATACAELLTERWDAMYPAPAIAELQKWGFMVGLGVGQNIWEVGEDGLLSVKLKVWHPRYVYWRWDTRSYWLNTESGSVEIKHADGQWVLFAPWGLERAYMMGGVRSLYVAWLVRQWAWRDWARFGEVHGMPIRKAFVPAGGDETDKQRFLREVADIGSESVLRIPRSANPEQGFDVELLEAAAEGHASFKDLLSEANSCIAINILGQNLTTEVKEGALASTGVHQTIEGQVLKRDGFEVAKCLKTGSYDIWAELNFGAKEDAPNVKFETDPPEDKAASAVTMKGLGEAISALNNAGLPVDGDKLAEKFNVPLVEGQLYEKQPTTAESAEKQAAADAAALKKAGPVAGKLSRKSAHADAIEGQMFVESLVDKSANAGVEALSRDFAAIEKAVEEATDFEDLRRRLEQRYSKMKVDQLSQVIEAALMLAELNGRHAVRAETDGA